MDEKAFGTFVTEMSQFFERRPVPDETFAQWFDEVKHLPTVALRSARSALRQLDTWPKNIPHFIKNTAGPSLQNQKHDAACHYGRFEVAKYLGNDTWAVWSFPCRCSVENGYQDRLSLLSSRLYDRPPERTQAQPPGWALIYPDQLSLEKMSGFHELKDCEATLNDGLPF